MSIILSLGVVAFLAILVFHAYVLWGLLGGWDEKIDQKDKL